MERDLREEKEKALRLERELEGWKGLRMERGSGVNRSGTMVALSEMGGGGGSRRGSAMYGNNEGGVSRRVSNSKVLL